MIEILGQSWVLRALLAAVLTGAVCSVLSVFVVLRRMAFIGQGISHAAFGGIALGLLLSGAESQAGLLAYGIATLFCIAVAIGIGVLARSRQISEDSAIGIFFAASMAVGVVILNFRSRFTGEVSGFLFGHVLAVSRADLIWMAVIGALAVVLVFLFIRQLYAMCYDEELAAATGIPVAALQLMLLVLLALVVIAAMKVVGVVLVSALLVMPAAFARLLTHRFGWMMLVSLVMGVGSAIAGILGTLFVVDAPSGAAIVLVQFALLCGAGIFAKFRGRPKGHDYQRE